MQTVLLCFIYFVFGAATTAVSINRFADTKDVVELRCLGGYVFAVYGEHTAIKVIGADDNPVRCIST